MTIRTRTTNSRCKNRTVTHTYITSPHIDLPSIIVLTHDVTHHHHLPTGERHIPESCRGREYRAGHRVIKNDGAWQSDSYASLDNSESPPSLSSAGLSDRIAAPSTTTSTSAASHPRLSTLLPNTSGYLAFLSKPNAELPKAKAHGPERSSSTWWKEYFRKIKTTAQRRRSLMYNKDSKSHEYARGLEEDETTLKSRGQSSGAVKLERQFPNSRKKRKINMGCIGGGRRALEDDGPGHNDRPSPTVIISSHDDPTKRPSSIYAGPSTSARPNDRSPPYSEEPIQSRRPMPPSLPLQIIRGNQGLNARRRTFVEPLSTGKIVNARIVDSRAGTAISSTKRVPTQKSVHPVLGSQSEGHGTVEQSESESDSGVREEPGAQRENGEHFVAQSSVTQNVDTPGFNILDRFMYHRDRCGRSTPTTPEGPQSDFSSGCESLSPFVGPSGTVPSSNDLAHRTSLILNPDEYEYLLNLHGVITRSNADHSFDTPAQSNKNTHRSDATESSSTSSTSSSSDTARPIVHSDTTLCNDTPTYSSLLTFSRLPTQIRGSYEVHPANVSTYAPPEDNDDEDRPVSSTEGDANRYREHVRRVVIEEHRYNDSPSPLQSRNKTDSSTTTSLIPRTKPLVVGDHKEAPF
ncbi:uncharacterized protein I303_100190 [Kwoniella dejecticola CBS 10117]|uniref:Uncharacterized protein n=1 Tax=Kwoniella dejecticola CBS 10117 TaxID=1296121 RepID=A0A1A6AE76_9TREE|nr:uncharacterized protein I303_00192 [Kwoniella dejecticola CBS 10117]OBR88377.1 hypothetical protein I303_00192 [Kwoniella dejecticola CBS 10117]